MSFLLTANKKECCDCKACIQICPKGCIKEQVDSKGFTYPYVDHNSCINCNLCVKACPMNKNDKNKVNNTPICYAGVHLNDEIVLNSSSGGAFTAIVESYCDENYVIFGATQAEDLSVVHAYTIDKKEAYKFRKSKYVQSNIKNTYLEVKKFLKVGKKVLYTGTPCQIAGLKGFLGKEYENLLCVELLCHGVASPLVLKKHIDYLSSTYKSRVKMFDMRTKVKVDNGYRLGDFSVELENGQKKCTRDTNYYNKYFFKQVGYRDCCYICPFAKIPRTGDVTIGDCWGIEEFRPNMFDNKGVSLIMLNNNKGEKILGALNRCMKLETITLEEAMRNNPNIYKPTDYIDDNEFWRNIENKPINKVFNQVIDLSYMEYFISLVPTSIKQKIKIIRKWF